ncbi:MAG: hypothetical protein E6X17_07855 [Sporomusaceae bacterium]|nr:hypothetical protein [Sporomusaceae bacterium]
MEEDYDMKNSGVLGTSFAMAAVWFATHCGVGFATGNQEVNYFVKYGWYSVFTTIASMTVLAWSYRNALVIAKDNQAHNYRSFADALYHPYEKYFSPVFEIGCILLTLVAVSTAIAGAGSLLQNALGIPYGIGIASMGTLLIILTIFGAELIIRVLKYKTYFLIAVLTLLCYLGLQAAPNLHRILAERTTFDNSIWSAVWSMLIYIGFQALAVVPIISTSHKITTTRECNLFGLFGLILNGGFLAVVSIMLLGYAPEILTESLPVYYVTTHLGLPWLKIVYSVLLFVALIGTAVSVTFSIVARFESLPVLKQAISNLRTRRAAIAAGTMLICTGVSVLGLTTLVVKGYGTLGYIGLFFVVLPELIVGTVKIRRKAFQRKQAGISE